jgi:type II secretory pathway pseudopilin PulG
MRRFHRSQAKGFTLVEVMAAATVLILIFVSSIGAITVGFRMLEDARMTTLASQVLQSEMEDMRLMNWTAVDALPASGTFPIQTSLANASFNKFTCSRKIAAVNSDMKKVTVAVTWQATNGNKRVRQYMTYIAKNGLNDYYYRTF